MAPLTFTFTLMMAVAIVTVKVKGAGLEDFLNLHAHKDHRYFYDVTTDASLVDLKASLDNFTLDHSYKVIAEARYLITFRSNDTDALQYLTFPPGSRVAQYPVELGEEYFEMFGVTQTGLWDFPENSTISEILLFHDWTLDPPKTQCPQTLEMEVKDWLEKNKIQMTLVHPIVYPVIATYPLRVLSFWAIEENAFQIAANAAVPMFGGVGSTKTVIKRIVKINLK